MAEVLSEKKPTKLVRVGVNDVFSESGKPTELYQKYGLDSKSIVKKVEVSLKETN